MQSSDHSSSTLRSGNSPFIVDLGMSDSRNPDLDFDFFDPGLPLDTTSPSTFLTDDFTTTSPRSAGAFASPIATSKKLTSHQAHFLERPSQNEELSARSSTSPAASFPDSSSDSSRYKRKSSSDSSRSALTGGDVMMADTDVDLADWKVDDMMVGADGSAFAGFDGTINPSAMNNNFGFSDKGLDHTFDFESVTSSPSPFGLGGLDMESPEMPTMKYDTPRRNTINPKSKIRKHSKAYSQNSVTQSMNGLTTSGSREVSPLSAMVTSQESSPTAFFNNSPSPNTGVDFISGSMLGGPGHTATWPTGMDFSHVANTQGKVGLAPAATGPSPLSQVSSSDSRFKSTLLIHPTPLKSRVETQIPIKMTLHPMPPGVTKLHLPTHTISKPKLLAKPPPEKTPDMLELHTTLVCTSAMHNPEARRRALARAAASPTETKEKSEGTDEEDEDSKPLNGGEVKICMGCITRERKRAARKKVKKVDEEESWHRDEGKRVIVFNTQEIKEWQQPSQGSTETIEGRPEPTIPDGALQIDAPMRIACYCRHQNEKLGFQVIFTIKDHKGRVIAQAVTSSIMITDDHKTHSVPSGNAQQQANNNVDNQMFQSNGSFQSENSLPMGPMRISHSSSDLQNMQRNYNSMQFSNQTQSSHGSQAVGMNGPPSRNLSRQASPSGSTGPSSKKRKASGSGKVPSGLAMTRLETAQQTPSSNAPNGSMSASTSAAASPFTPNGANFPQTNDAQFGKAPVALNNATAFHTGPPTPNSNDQVMFFSNANRSQSMENLAMQSMYSAPASAHQSRAPSPNGLRNGMPVFSPQSAQHQAQQAQIAQAVANGLYGVPLALNPHRPPTIHKLIPNEGPIAGGIEVTCLGSGFCQGLEVMFGDVKATTSTFWGETSIVCLLPPAAFPGSVPVTFKHQHQTMQPYPTPPIQKQQVLFKYIDDDEQQIIRTALAVLGHKMTGKMEDVRDLARRIVGDGSSSWSLPTAGSSNGAGQTRGAQHEAATSALRAAFGVDVETTLLKCLDLIDLDDSPNMPRLNLRRPSGQTMLHLACSLGLHRFAAALLARGANPEVRDKNGFTPLHFAALRNHPQIVRRLILSGADPTIRSLDGYTPADLASSEEVLRSTRRIEHHHRSRSSGALRSRTNSATSIRSLWEPLTPADSNTAVVDDSSFESSDGEDYSEDGDEEDNAFWMQPHRRMSQRQSLEPASKPTPSRRVDLSVELPDRDPAAALTPSAYMAAFREQLTQQIQHFQQSVQLNFPNLPQMPALPVMPNLNDYQSYLPQRAPIARRISSLIPPMGGNRTDAEHPNDKKWWDNWLPQSSAPPAYEELFPQGTSSSHTTEDKKVSVIQAAAEAAADNKCVQLFDQQQAESSKTMECEVQTNDGEEQMMVLQANKVKRLRSDHNLFFIWIPLLLVIMLAMLYSRRSTIEMIFTKVMSVVRSYNQNYNREPECLVPLPNPEAIAL